jgi:hypothetical protein
LPQVITRELLEVEFILALLVVLAILVLAFVAPKLVARIIVIGGFLGIVFASVYANGFQKA